MGSKLFRTFTDNRTKITNWLFYIALTIELVLMIVEKSEIPFSYESYVFRITFLLTFLAVLLMKHDLKEWIVIAVICVLAGYCYYASGKNDMLRLALLIFAGRDINLKKVMKYTFYVCLVGFLVIVLLSVAGLLGDVTLTIDYGRSTGVETRYVFGFGHPNTLFSSVYALIMMWIWIYGKKARILPYLVTLATVVMLLILTDSRTGIVILVFTMILAILSRMLDKLSYMKWPYILGGFGIAVLSLVLSPMAAFLANSFYRGGWNPLGEKAVTLEAILNYRISNLYYGSDNHMATLNNWKLFAPRGNESFFDMGWVRLYYWYGIIPAVIIIFAILITVYESWRQRDIWTLILIVSLGIYTLVEATFVTRYLGRDFFLLIAGGYLGKWFHATFIEKSSKGATNA